MNSSPTPDQGYLLATAVQKDHFRANIKLQNVSSGKRRGAKGSGASNLHNSHSISTKRDNRKRSRESQEDKSCNSPTPLIHKRSTGSTRFSLSFYSSDLWLKININEITTFRNVFICTGWHASYMQISF